MKFIDCISEIKYPDGSKVEKSISNKDMQKIKEDLLQGHYLMASCKNCNEYWEGVDIYKNFEKDEDGKYICPEMYCHDEVAIRQY